MEEPTLEQLDFSEPLEAEAPAEPEASAEAAPEPEPETAEGEEAPPEAEAAEEGSEEEESAPKDPMEHRLQVKRQRDGKELELTVKDLKNYYERNHGQENVIRNLKHENTQIRGEVEQLFGKIKEDPNLAFDLLKQLGLDPAETAYEYLQRTVQERKMSPEMRRAKQLEQENREYREQLARQEQARARAREQQEVEATQQEFRQAWEPAMQNVGLPVNDRTVAQMARVAQRYLDDYGVVTAEDAPRIAGEVLETIREEMKAYSPLVEEQRRPVEPTPRTSKGKAGTPTKRRRREPPPTMDDVFEDIYAEFGDGY